MHRVPGVQLDLVWSSLTAFEKDSISNQLRGIFDSMRKAESPWPSFFGGSDGGSLHHEMFYSQHGDQNPLGPYCHEAALVEGLAANFRALTERNFRPDFKARFYEAQFHRVLQGHRSTLKHGDVQKKNVMIVEAKDSAGDDMIGRSFDIVLVDWETAGWYPDFWEFFCASSTFDFFYWEEDWCWQVANFLEVWPAETAIMRMLDKDMGG